MHYYTHNFGDYAKDAGHLTTLQHGIYRKLMDVYYVTEQPIPVLKAARLAGVSQAEVDVVLGDFFELSEDGTVWRHKRIDAEIAAYHAKAEKNRQNGAKGGRPKNPGGSDSDTEDDPNGKANRKPGTKNQQDPPKPPKGGKRERGVTLKTFVANLKGENAFSPEDPIMEYADSIKLPAVFLKLAWLEFQARTGDRKVQIDWRATFRNYVRGNYLKLWFEDGNGWSLTTAGKQAWATHMAGSDEL